MKQRARQRANDDNEKNGQVILPNAALVYSFIFSKNKTVPLFPSFYVFEYFYLRMYMRYDCQEFKLQASLQIISF